MDILRNSDCGDDGSSGITANGGFLVTEIKAAVRNKNRVNVFVDGEYEFSLDIAQVVDMGLKVGQKLNAEKLAEYKEASEFGKLYQRALEWVLIRPRSVQETREYLKRKQMDRKTKSYFWGRSSGPSSRASSLSPRRDCGLPQKQLFCFSDVMMSQVLERLVRKGYVDDRRFAKYYVENRFVKKGVSERRMRQELVQKGISKELVEEVLNSGVRDEVSEIRKMIERKRARYDDEKLIAYLVRQGFDYQLARTEVLRKADETD